MTPTGDLEIDFITPHASVILAGLPRPIKPGKGPGKSGIEEYASRCGGSARQPMHESAGKGCHPAIPMPPKCRSIHWQPETHGDKSAKPRPPATPTPNGANPAPEVSPCTLCHAPKSFACRPL